VFAPFAEAMSQAMLLPAAILLVGLVAALSFARPEHQQRPATGPVADDTATSPATGSPVAS
jgi:hypothetical protein